MQLDPPQVVEGKRDDAETPDQGEFHLDLTAERSLPVSSNSHSDSSRNFVSDLGCRNTEAEQGLKQAIQFHMRYMTRWCCNSFHKRCRELCAELSYKRFDTSCREPDEPAFDRLCMVSCRS